jgi:pimeloyl-ACP methyl ester carboxylesterase
MRRGFVDVPDGQIHYRRFGDVSKPPLIMLHGSPGSAYSLAPLASHLARDRFVFALDTLGNGDSTPARISEPSIPYLADAHFAAIQALGLKQFDLYGYHTGTGLSTEIAVRHPENVRRIVLDGLSIFNANTRGDYWAERTGSPGLGKDDHAPDIPPDLNGTQLMTAWSMVRDAHLFWPWWDRRPDHRRSLGLPSAEYLHGEVIEILKSCRTYFLSYRAALRYNRRERLPLISQPVLVTACPSDQLFEFLDEAAAFIKGAEKRVSPERDTEEDLAATARIMLDFLDAA